MVFMGNKNSGLFVAGNGLLYGLVGYVILYIWCVDRVESETINASLTNWHWMEVTGHFHPVPVCQGRINRLAFDTIHAPYVEDDIAN